MKIIKWTSRARKQLSKIADQKLRSHLFTKITALGHWPDCRLDIKALTSRDEHRLRVGDWRIIFTIMPDSIHIEEVKKRNENTY